MSAQELRGVRRRFLALPLLIVACACLCAAHVRRVGATYEYPLAE